MVILIVEDEILVGLALKLVLRIGGYCVLGPAATAEDALHLAQVQHPDLAFVDITLSGEEDGIAVAQALTTRYGTSCIFLTAELDRARSSKEAALGVIAKPYDPPELLRAVKLVKAIRKGALPSRIPRHLELFQ